LHVAQIGGAHFLLDVEPIEIVRLARPRHLCVVGGDRGAEPSRPRVDEQPEASFRIAVELEEVVASAKRPQMSRRCSIPVVSVK
jgi:hypothetical protein